MGKKNDNFRQGSAAARAEERAHYAELGVSSDVVDAVNKIRGTVAQRDASTAEARSGQFSVYHHPQADGTMLSTLAHPQEIYSVGGIHWDPKQGGIHGVVVADKYRHGLAKLIAETWKHADSMGGVGAYNPGFTSEGRTMTNEKASRVMRNVGPSSMKPRVPAKGDAGRGEEGRTGTGDVMRFLSRFSS